MSIVATMMNVLSAFIYFSTLFTVTFIAQLTETIVGAGQIDTYGVDVTSVCMIETLVNVITNYGVVVDADVVRVQTTAPRGSKAQREVWMEDPSRPEGRMKRD